MRWLDIAAGLVAMVSTGKWSKWNRDIRADLWLSYSLRAVEPGGNTISNQLFRRVFREIPIYPSKQLASDENCRQLETAKNDCL